MKGLFKVLLPLAVLTLVFGCSPKEDKGSATADKAKPITIRFSHNQPENSAEQMGALAFKKEVEEKSGGQMTVQIFPALQLGSMREQVEAVQMGSNQMTLQPVAVLTSFVDELQVVDFPFLWPNAEKMWMVLDGEPGKMLLDTCKAKGMVGLGFWGSGFKQITTNGKEIHMPSDFSGVKMRVMPSPLLLEQYKAWGANPVPIEYAELYNALQQKIVDGQENPLSTIAMNKFYEVQDTIVMSNHGFLAYVCIANEKWFDKLSPENQKIIRDAEIVGHEVQRKELAAKEAAYLEEIKKSGIKVIELTDENRRAFLEASLGIHKQFADTDRKKEILEAVNKAL